MRLHDIRRPLMGIYVALSIGIATPAQSTGIPVFDGSNQAQWLLDIIEQGKHLDELGKQFDKLVETYNHAIKNAKRLGNLDELNDLARAFDSLVGSDLTKAVMGGVHGVDLEADDYLDQVYDVLASTYDVPERPRDLAARLEGRFGDIGTDLSGLIEDTEALRAEFEQPLMTQRAISESTRASVASRGTIDQYRGALSSLGDDDLAASMQLNAAGTLHTASQMELVLDHQRMNLAQTEAVRLRELEQTQVYLRAREERLLALQNDLNNFPRSGLNPEDRGND